MKNKRLKNFSSGITLIALVVTIVVLLILAGVSISMLTGENGIIIQASESKILTNLGNVEDSYRLYLTSKKIEQDKIDDVNLDTLSFLTKVYVGENEYVYAINNLNELQLDMKFGQGTIENNISDYTDLNDVYFVDKKGNVAYVLNQKLYGSLELAKDLTPTREDFFLFDAETGTITGIAENTSKDPNGVGYYYNDLGEKIISEEEILIPSTINGVPVVNIAGFVEYVGAKRIVGAFFGCSNLKAIVIPDSVTSIGANAFEECSELINITIPNSVTSIGGLAFSGCTSLTNITIPNSVTSIGDFAFWGCSSITNIKVEEGNTVYDSRENCNAIIEKSSNKLLYGCKNTIIPNSVISIGDSAFEECTGLTNITIPNSVTSIETSAFYECTDLTNITIPSSVTRIRNFAFSGCTELTSIKVDENNITYDSRDNCNAIIEKSSNILLSGCKNTIIPSSVTSIGNYAFQGCTGLTNITIPSSVTSIGNYAFSGCTGLTSITIPNSVTSIDAYAFYKCTELTEIIIESGSTLTVPAHKWGATNATIKQL